MAEERAAAAGMYLTALPKKPQRRNTNNPEALSASEGSGQGIPACSSAWPEAQPLTGEIRNDPTTSSTNHIEGNSGLGPIRSLTPGLEPSPSQGSSSLGMQRTGGQSAIVQAETPTASTPLPARRITFPPAALTLGGRSRSSPPHTKESAIQKLGRAAKHPPPKPSAPNRSHDGDAGGSSGSASETPLLEGLWVCRQTRPLPSPLDSQEPPPAPQLS